MTYLNFHAHRPAAAPDERVVHDGVDSWGIHPWKVGEPPFLCPLDEQQRRALLAIGECGLDSLCGTSLDLQREAFRQCIALSETLQKPLIVHCVRQMDPCLQMRRQTGATQPWIWHGFRGSEARMNRLLAAGFYLSFGFRHRPDALAACPADRLLLETDDDPRSIATLYELVAACRDISVSELCQQMQANWQRLFG